MKPMKPVLKGKHVNPLYMGEVLVGDSQLAELVSTFLKANSCNKLVIHWKFMREGWSRDSELSSLSIFIRIDGVKIDYTSNISLPNGEMSFESEELKKLFKLIKSLTRNTYGLYGEVEFLRGDSGLEIKNKKGQ
jgi:hypothetical protein